ncbi:hypothetical protein Pint_09452 [Pistacia integerrima]|uniref:Uncharacterized protein n=3 Tax=Pistacia integerrima TaxID=434235 RepID=A0ACC0XIP7_9ROSI|nr:hypothetical protein Pint_09452 [Pistacia integerrima]
MHSLGVNAYRFSISWLEFHQVSVTEGRFGEVNPSGIMFYNNIIDHLLLRGIEPFVTIFHFDLPQELEDRYGSWLSPLIHLTSVHTLSFSVSLKKKCSTRFSIELATINEPNLLSKIGYVRGWYPPAHCSEPFGNCSAGNSDVEPLIVMRNMLLSHAKAVKLYREQFQVIE